MSVVQIPMAVPGKRIPASSVAGQEMSVAVSADYDRPLRPVASKEALWKQPVQKEERIVPKKSVFGQDAKDRLRWFLKSPGSSSRFSSSRFSSSSSFFSAALPKSISSPSPSGSGSLSPTISQVVYSSEDFSCGDQVYEPSTTALHDVFQPLLDSHLARNGFSNFGAELTAIFEPLMTPVLIQKNIDPELNVKDETEELINSRENNDLDIIKDLEILSNKFKSLKTKMRTEILPRVVLDCEKKYGRMTGRVDNNPVLSCLIEHSSTVQNLIHFARQNGDPTSAVALQHMTDFGLFLILKEKEGEMRDVLGKMKKKLFVFAESVRKNEVLQSRSVVKNQAGESVKKQTKKKFNHGGGKDNVGQIVSDRAKPGGHGNGWIQSMMADRKKKLSERKASHEKYLNEKYSSEKKSRFFEKNKHWLGVAPVIEIGKKLDKFVTKFFLTTCSDTLGISCTVTDNTEKTNSNSQNSHGTSYGTQVANHYSSIDRNYLDRNYIFSDHEEMQRRIYFSQLQADFDFRELSVDTLVAYIHLCDLKRWEKITREFITIPILKKFICPMSAVCKEFSAFFSSSQYSSSSIGPRSGENPSSAWSQLLHALRKFRVLLRVAIQIKSAEQRET